MIYLRETADRLFICSYKNARTTCKTPLDINVHES